MTYKTTSYYSVFDYQFIYEAHQTLARQYRADQFDTTEWYWKTALRKRSEDECHQESVGPFKLCSGPLPSMPLPLVVIFMDSQIKAYMDRDALGEAVRHSAAKDRNALRTARESELARRIGTGSLEGNDTQMVVIECRGYVVGGILVNPGKRDETVATIMHSPFERAAASLATLQARYALPSQDPFLARKESEIVDLIRYFRIPDPELKRILAPQLAQRESYRKTCRLIRALTLSEAFAVTQRWVAKNGRAITVGVCETPNREVKHLIEGKMVKNPDGERVRVGGIPHRILTAATGAELYPAAYKNRPEGKTKIYTLYAFDFSEVALKAMQDREEATKGLDDAAATLVGG